MMASDGFQFYLGSHHLALYARCHYAENMTSPIGTRQAFPPTAVLLWVIHRWPRHLDCMANLCYHLAAHTPLAIDGKEDMDLHKYLYCSELTRPWRPLKLKSRWLCCCAEGRIRKAQSNLESAIPAHDGKWRVTPITVLGGRRGSIPMIARRYVVVPGSLILSQDGDKQHKSHHLRY